MPFIETRGTQFVLGDAPFAPFGVNCYFLAYCCDQSRRDALAAAKRMGANTVRSWAFLNTATYTPGQPSFQYISPQGITLNEGPDGLQRLDSLIAAAEQADVRLILPMVNHWDALGGMNWYVNFLGGKTVTDFYRLPPARAAYQNYVNELLTRRNTITRRLYSEEPAIFAWELTNEARCETPGGRELLLDWIAEMAAFVKERDANHLLALGDEGFFYKAGQTDLYDGSHGVDWEANLADPNIDFGAHHFYPQEWGHASDPEFASKWLADHAAVARRVGKPVVMEEYGLKFDNAKITTEQDRQTWYGMWLQAVRDTGTAGALLWMLGHRAPDTAGYVDKYVEYAPG